MNVPLAVVYMICLQILGPKEKLAKQNCQQNMRQQEAMESSAFPDKTKIKLI